jgi:hypothetical protein
MASDTEKIVDAMILSHESIAGELERGAHLRGLSGDAFQAVMSMSCAHTIAAQALRVNRDLLK